jgi:hypothetical protein
LARFEFESRIVLFCFSFTFVLFGESCLLVSRCANGGLAYSDDDRGRSRRLVQRTGDGRTGRVLGGRAVERSAGAVCGLHLARGD